MNVLCTITWRPAFTRPFWIILTIPIFTIIALKHGRSHALTIVLDFNWNNGHVLGTKEFIQWNFDYSTSVTYSETDSVKSCLFSCGVRQTIFINKHFYCCAFHNTVSLGEINNMKVVLSLSFLLSRLYPNPKISQGVFMFSSSQHMSNSYVLSMSFYLHTRVLNSIPFCQILLFGWRIWNWKVSQIMLNKVKAISRGCFALIYRPLREMNCSIKILAKSIFFLKCRVHLKHSLEYTNMNHERKMITINFPLRMQSQYHAHSVLHS